MITLALHTVVGFLNLYHAVAIASALVAAHWEQDVWSDVKKCPTGTFGLKCEGTCSTHCAGVDNACNHVDGTCSDGCDPGYRTAQCNVSCNRGTYGQDCNETCSNTCAGESNTCNHVNGTCDLGCDPGYLGALCDLGKSANLK
ncbi:multiple epidermal growth factor-like domains 10 [Plakobranchus ocellatus]|uniref:Multiple epidermal growth factor-like domains 10 n=1 Tax=Plakobranchus ocellatus TaxID=259542 RepID=A0AAV4BVF0_9GAST|nr:multiple epidermal growth factor-like domains 10 [Plakobranchus ocellatus]